MERKFKIGDFVNCEGKKCEVLAYSGNSYTINIGKNGHDGKVYSFDENGNAIDPHCDTCWYVVEGEINEWKYEPLLRYFLISYRTNNGFANATFKEFNIPSFKRMREVIGCDFTLINLMELSRDDFESLTENKI